MVSVEDVLREFDSAAEAREFAVLGHPYSYLVVARLHAYGDRVRWAMVVESAGYNPRADNLVDVLHVYGNCLAGRDRRHVEHLRRIDEFIEDETGIVARPVSVTIRGSRVGLTTAPGEDLEDALRRLVPRHRDLILADEDELRRWLPGDLPEILRLDEWHHTDTDVMPPGAERERRREHHRILASVSGSTVPFETLPSDTEAYRQLAEVLATGDVTRYAPTLPANTHWSHWPESGSM